MPLTCRNILELRDTFIDGELSPSLSAEVHAHLLQCPECQRQLELVRALGDVIAKDHAAPRLPTDFADRVVAALPPAVVQSDRRMNWRSWTVIGLPAAAALFLAIAFWPREDTAKPTLVAGMSVVKSMVDPTLDAVAQTRQTADSIKGLWNLSVNQARQDVHQGLSRTARSPIDASGEPSITRILLQPFDEIWSPNNTADQKPEDPETVRF